MAGGVDLKKNQILFNLNKVLGNTLSFKKIYTCIVFVLRINSENDVE